MGTDAPHEEYLALVNKPCRPECRQIPDWNPLLLVIVIACRLLLGVIGVAADVLSSSCQYSSSLAGQDLGSEPVQDLPVQPIIGSYGNGSSSVSGVS